MTPGAIVHIIDDNVSLRNMVVKLVGSVGLASKPYSSADEFLSSYDGSRPGCIILDLRMPGMTGTQALTRFAEKDIKLPVIILTGYGDIPTAVRSLKQGAVDFIQKPFNPQVLIERIQTSIEEDAMRAQADHEFSALTERFIRLSLREREILDLVVDGKTSKEIARTLNISSRTVDVHRTNVMRKVGASSVAELVGLAMAARKKP